MESAAVISTGAAGSSSRSADAPVGTSVAASASMLERMLAKVIAGDTEALRSHDSTRNWPRGLSAA
jgi:hypothetical protein